MIDYVHDHFAKHRDPVRPRIVCADGYSLSVQASGGHYCSPRETNAPRYSMVEVGFPRTADGRPSRPSSLGKGDAGIYGWTRVALVNALIARHGGIKEY